MAYADKLIEEFDPVRSFPVNNGAVVSMINTELKDIVNAKYDKLPFPLFLAYKAISPRHGMFALTRDMHNRNDLILPTIHVFNVKNPEPADGVLFVRLLSRYCTSKLYGTCMNHVKKNTFDQNTLRDSGQFVAFEKRFMDLLINKKYIDALVHVRNSMATLYTEFEHGYYSLYGTFAPDSETPLMLAIFDMIDKSLFIIDERGGDVYHPRITINSIAARPLINLAISDIDCVAALRIHETALRLDAVMTTDTLDTHPDCIRSTLSTVLKKSLQKFRSGTEVIRSLEHLDDTRTLTAILNTRVVNERRIRSYLHLVINAYSTFIQTITGRILPNRLHLPVVTKHDNAEKCIREVLPFMAHEVCMLTQKSGVPLPSVYV